jgi:hypothetical protein
MKTKHKLYLIALYVVITISILHAKEQRNQWREQQIKLATGGYND